MKGGEREHVKVAAIITGLGERERERERERRQLSVMEGEREIKMRKKQ